jgi:diaminopimelate epimerase
MIPFAKAHACGNDFLIIQEKFIGNWAPDDLARRLCHRTRGVGADGVEFYTRQSEHSGRIHLYNADGSTAEISGNGTRCVAAWIAEELGAGPGQELLLETDAGPRSCRIVSREFHRFQIGSYMGVPEVWEHAVTLADGRRVDGAAVSTGNPHFVIRVDRPDFNLYGRAWQSVGEEISRHPDFPRRTNVEFVHSFRPDEIEIRIYERGVGPTTSSGTGTCASASAAIRLWGAKPQLHVAAEGGEQIVEWPGNGSEMLLTGPAEVICYGEAFD